MTTTTNSIIAVRCAYGYDGCFFFSFACRMMYAAPDTDFLTELFFVAMLIAMAASRAEIRIKFFHISVGTSDARGSIDISIRG